MNGGKKLRIGCGSGYERDSRELAVAMAEKGNVQYLCFDALAERTLALAQARKLEDPTKGYNPLMEAKLRALLPICLTKGIKIISNFGAANPEAAGKKTAEIVKELGFKGVKIATITGDNVFHLIRELKLIDMETDKPLEIKGELVSANAYIGSDPIVEALEQGADIVVGGRIGDLALFLAPMIYEFGWGAEDWDRKGAGATVAHLLECGVHSVGANFAFPGYVDVPGMDHLSLPLADVEESGEAVIGKIDGTGGVVSELSLAAQLCYEVFDPANYLTPDVNVDVRNVQLKQVGKDKVRVSGAKGKPAPKDLKIMVGVNEGYIAESEGGWAGWGSYEKAQTTIDKMIKPHLAKFGKAIEESRIDIVGVNAMFGSMSPAPAAPPNEVRLRVAIKTRDAAVADEFCDQMERDMFFGCVGVGGVKRSVRPLLAIHPTLIPRERIPLTTVVEEVK